MDQYGNPIQHHTGGGAATGAGHGAQTGGGADTGAGCGAQTGGMTGCAGTGEGQQQQMRPDQMDGHGHQGATGTTGTGANTTAGYRRGGAVREPEKKGMVEKIKEKLPGQH